MGYPHFPSWKPPYIPIINHHEPYNNHILTIYGFTKFLSWWSEAPPAPPAGHDPRHADGPRGQRHPSGSPAGALRRGDAEGRHYPF